MLKADSIQNFIPKKDCFIGDLQLKCSVYRGLTTAFYLLRLAPLSPFEASKILKLMFFVFLALHIEDAKLAHGVPVELNDLSVDRDV